VPGFLTDHYDGETQTLRLSQVVAGASEMAQPRSHVSRAAGFRVRR
jgi:Zn-dependent membrane protease YugP